MEHCAEGRIDGPVVLDGSEDRIRPERWRGQCGSGGEAGEDRTAGMVF